MDSKFAKYLKDNQIDSRRLIAASRELERLRPEDRKKKLERRREKAAQASAAPGTAAKSAIEKPRSGRSLTPKTIEAASAGKPLSGTQKTRVLRAVNRVLEQKKKDPADLRALF
jgi:hypothetical protein